MVSTPVMKLSHLAALGLSLSALVAPAFADARLTGIACRSVHLGYEGAEGTAFYNEATVTDTAPGSYFMCVGWNTGYFGIQDQGLDKDGKEKKVVLFSLWDNDKTDDKNATPESLRTKAVYHDPAVRIGRFGGEGTGGQSFFNYAWKKGETYRFMVKSRAVEGGRTEIAGFFYIPETKTWKHLATFSAPNKNAHIHGMYSFVEDFRRNRESTKFTRRAEFGPAYYLDDKGEWKNASVAKFTADGNKAVNIDSGLSESKKRFFIATGGPIENTHTKLWSKTTLAGSPARPPEDVEAVLKAGFAPAVCAEAPKAVPAAK